MSRRNLERDPNTRQLLDTFDDKSLAGASSSVGFLGVRTLTDIALDFCKRLLSFGPALG